MSSTPPEYEASTGYAGTGRWLDRWARHGLQADGGQGRTRARGIGADALARLTSDTPLPGGPTTQWTYDANGNRLTQVQGTRSETYLHGPHDNKLYQVDILDNGTPDTRILGRDARGALTLDTHLFSSLGWSGVDMGYTRFGDLANPPIYEALEVTEQKNHEAQRIRDSRWVTWDMENDGRYLTTQDQLYDLDGQLLEQHEVLPSSLLRQFVYLDGQPLAMITGYGDIHYFHNDHLGTPQVLTNGSGAVTWKARYDAFGKATLLVNAVEQPLRFPGQVVDRHVPELHYNWHRYYDTTTGRYVSSDPIGLEGGWNTFTYAVSNPVQYSDFDGLRPMPPVYAPPSGLRGAPVRSPSPGARPPRPTQTTQRSPRDREWRRNLGRWKVYVKCNVEGFTSGSDEIAAVDGPVNSPNCTDEGCPPPYTIGGWAYGRTPGSASANAQHDAKANLGALGKRFCYTRHCQDVACYENGRRRPCPKTGR
jgi:RHS repeat-associated protein